MFTEVAMLYHRLMVSSDKKYKPCDPQGYWLAEHLILAKLAD
jgi:hypothetical protein